MCKNKTKQKPTVFTELIEERNGESTCSLLLAVYVLSHCPEHCLKSLLFSLWKDRVYIASWADLSTERPWSLKWWEQLIYLCLLLCLYLLLLLTIKILTKNKNKWKIHWQLWVTKWPERLGFWKWQSFGNAITNLFSFSCTCRSDMEWKHRSKLWKNSFSKYESVKW